MSPSLCGRVPVNARTRHTARMVAQGPGSGHRLAARAEGAAGARAEAVSRLTRGGDIGSASDLTAAVADAGRQWGRVCSVPSKTVTWLLSPTKASFRYHDTPTFFNMTKGSKTLRCWNANDSSQRNLTKSLQRRSQDLENYEGIGCKWLQLNIKLTLKNRVSFRWRTKYECIINWGDARRTMPIEKWGVSERI